jgi:hypothetical protein
MNREAWKVSLLVFGGSVLLAIGSWMLFAYVIVKVLQWMGVL